MAKSKKFDFTVEQDGTTWTAQIVRRKTARENVISKTQTDFASEAAAIEWATAELAGFLKNLNAKNKRKK